MKEVWNKKKIVVTVMENELNEGEIISFLLAQFRNSKSMAPTNSEFYSVQKEFKCELK